MKRTVIFTALLIAILFLSLLPYFGTAWHRVLPEHSHLFIGSTQKIQQDILPAAISQSEADAQFDVGDLGASVIHTPDPAIAFQFFAYAIALIALPFIFVRNGFSFRLLSPSLFYSPPLIPPPDPPPTAN